MSVLYIHMSKVTNGAVLSGIYAGRITNKFGTPSIQINNKTDEIILAITGNMPQLLENIPFGTYIQLTFVKRLKAKQGIRNIWRLKILSHTSQHADPLPRFGLIPSKDL